VILNVAFDNQKKHWWLATVVPILTTLICWPLAVWLPSGSLSLLYLASVLITAVETSVRPALWSALLSFLTYNFFFTAPRFTLFILHHEDIITALVLILVALLTGQLAASLREKVDALEASLRWNRDQMALAQAMSDCMDANSLVEQFTTRLTSWFGSTDSCIEPLSDEESQAAASILTSDSVSLTESAGGYLLYLRDMQAQCQGWRFTFGEDRSPESRIQVNSAFELFKLAWSRIQLAQRLQNETMEKEREQLRSALLSSISHDLRTPLATMIGSVSTLIDLPDSLSAEQKEELLVNTLSEARRLDRYIQKLLDMTKIGQGELKLERDWVDVDEILSVVLRRIQPLLHGQTVDLHYPSDLPLFNLHAALVEQAIFNVLENAVRFTPADRSIRIDVFTEGDDLNIDITDSGPGIAADHWSRIFDMFFTLAHGDQQTGGTGLGLAICQSVLGAHGGQARVLFSSPEKGSCIRLCLPYELTHREKSA
jgi:two-component system sensor histidine kinase KdpD